MTANCPVCSREAAEAKAAAAPARPRAARASTSTSRPARPTRSASHVRIKQAATAADDGYRSELVPGIKATADAERLAAALAASVARLEQLASDPPEPYATIAAEPDPGEAAWRAFLLVHLGAEEAARAPAWAAGGGAGPDDRTVRAFRAWAARYGGPASAFAGEAVWSPERRFGTVLERLSLPGFGRDRRYELLVVLGAMGTFPLAADALHPAGEEPTTLAAKRVFNSGDTMLLERRARALIEAVGVPMDTLDRALATWGAAPRGSRPESVPDHPAAAAARAALELA